MIDRRAFTGILAGKGIALLGLANHFASNPPALMYAPSAEREEPVVNLPRSMREWNWGGGSCVHASTVMVFRWSGNYALADYWRKNYSGGESYNGLVGKLNRNKIPWYSSYADGNAPPNDVACGLGDEFAAVVNHVCGECRVPVSFYGTANGDPKALFQAIKDRRGATIFYKPNHSIMLVDIDETRAIVLDNNSIEKYESYPTASFIRQWQGFGGVAVVPVIGTPRPPQPA